MMMRLAEWGQRIVTFRSGAVELRYDAVFQLQSFAKQKLQNLVGGTLDLTRQPRAERASVVIRRTGAQQGPAGQGGQGMGQQGTGQPGAGQEGTGQPGTGQGRGGQGQGAQQGPADGSRPGAGTGDCPYVS